jgi:hypothetical protein
LAEVPFLVCDPAAALADELGLVDQRLEFVDIDVARAACQSAKLFLTTAFRTGFPTHVLAPFDFLIRVLPGLIRK